MLYGALEPGPPGSDQPKGGAAALCTPAKLSAGRKPPFQPTPISEETAAHDPVEASASDNAAASDEAAAGLSRHEGSEGGANSAPQSSGAAETASVPETAAGNLNAEEWVLVGDSETVSTVPGSPLDGHRYRKKNVGSFQLQLQPPPPLPPQRHDSSHLDDECAICLELLVDAEVRNNSAISSSNPNGELSIERLPCGHCFHKECVVGLRGKREAISLLIVIFVIMCSVSKTSSRSLLIFRFAHVIISLFFPLLYAYYHHGFVLLVLGGLGAKRAASCPLCRAALPPAPGEVSWHATQQFLAVRFFCSALFYTIVSDNKSSNRYDEC